jgi:hypothetical protein
MTVSSSGDFLIMGAPCPWWLSDYGSDYMALGPIVLMEVSRSCSVSDP